MCTVNNSQCCCNRSSHELHKQEAFQGMRAYHVSEIHHKQDAIGVLKSFMTTVITVDGAIIGGLVTGILAPELAIFGALAIFVFTIIAGHFLVDVTKSKMDKDNHRYEHYRNDYINEIITLNIKDARSHWFLTEDRSDSGVKKTQGILTVYYTIIVFVSLFGALLCIAVS